VVAVSPFWLDIAYAINELVILDLRVLVGVVDRVEQPLVNRPAVEDNGVVLVESVIQSVSHYHSLAVRREVVVHDGADKWLRDVLLDEHSFVHSEWVVIHSPPACLFRLVCEHSYTLGLGVVREGTQQGDEPQHRLRNDDVRVFVAGVGFVV
jgi:hypothetical protein